MNRLQKKCIVASAVTHGLLLVVALFGAAFFKSKAKQPELPPLTMFDARVVDQLLASGGNPNVQPTPPPPQPVQPPPQPAPQPEPPRPQPRKVEPVKTPDPPVKPEPVRKPDPKPVAKPVEVKPERPRIVPNTKLVRRPPTEVPQTNERAEADRQREQMAAAKRTLESSLKNLRTSLGSEAVVENHGPGGEAFINYALLVKQKYDQAWMVADDVADDSAATRVKVVIARNGTVLNATIVNRSGTPALDRSVQRALDAVRFIAPFPEGARDAQRTFYINFNLKAKRQLG